MTSATTLEMALVGLLRQKPQSGYDLRKTFATKAMRHYSDSPGSIYPALRRLETRGWIAPEAQAGSALENRRGRQVFHLVAAGDAALIEWLGQPVTRDDAIFRMPELMLRFAYMDGNVPRSTALRFLEDFEQELGVYVAELRADFDRMSSALPINTGLLGFQSGIEVMEAQLTWVRQARVRLAGESQ
jgi:DNA-binding PadR family transcriptional regulator